MPADELEQQLVKRIRGGDADAWRELIERFEGRLLAFVRSRLRNQETSEDVVQEAFMGFLISLPNYDDRTPLESYLFSIAAHKLTDNLRREGRRPTIPFYSPTSESGTPQITGPGRHASSLVRSREGKSLEHEVIAHALAELVAGWREAQEYERLKCIELLFVLGMANKDVASRLGISEQAVANHKHFVVNKLKESARRAAIQDRVLATLGLE